MANLINYLKWTDLEIAAKLMLLVVIFSCIFFGKLKTYLEWNKSIDKLVESLKEYSIPVTSASTDLWTLYTHNTQVKRLVKILALRKSIDDVEEVLEQDVGRAGLLVFVCVGLLAIWQASHEPEPSASEIFQKFNEIEPLMILESLFVIHAMISLFQVRKELRLFEAWQRDNQ